MNDVIGMRLEAEDCNPPSPHSANDRLTITRMDGSAVEALFYGPTDDAGRVADELRRMADELEAP